MSRTAMFVLLGAGALVGVYLLARQRAGTSVPSGTGASGNVVPYNPASWAAPAKRDRPTAVENLATGLGLGLQVYDRIAAVTGGQAVSNGARFGK